jgi:hypothetical protein
MHCLAIKNSNLFIKRRYAKRSIQRDDIRSQSKAFRTAIK